MLCLCVLNSDFRLLLLTLHLDDRIEKRIEMAGSNLDEPHVEECVEVEEKSSGTTDVPSKESEADKDDLKLELTPESRSNSIQTSCSSSAQRKLRTKKVSLPELYVRKCVFGIFPKYMVWLRLS